MYKIYEIDKRTQQSKVIAIRENKDEAERLAQNKKTQYTSCIVEKICYNSQRLDK
jgi:hypothetical protein